MMGLSFWHLLIVLIVVFIVFGAGRLPEVLGELGKGVKAFKEGMGEGGVKPSHQPKLVAKAQTKKNPSTLAKASAAKGKNAANVQPKSKSKAKSTRKA